MNSLGRAELDAEPSVCLICKFSASKLFNKEICARMQNMLRVLLLLSLTSPVFASSWQAAYLFDFLQSSRNFDTNGQPQALGNARFYELYRQRLDLYYRSSRNYRWLIGSELNYGRSSDGIDERSNLQLNRINFGLEREFHSRYGVFSLGNNNHLALYQVDENTDEVLVGEGANELHFYASYRSNWGRRLAIFARYGYLMRQQGRSDLSTYDASLRLITMPLTLSLGVEGFQSVSDDEFVNTRIRRDSVSDRVSGGSFHYYAVNPSRLDMVVWGNYAFTDSFAMRLGYRQSLSGNNSADATSIFVNAFVNFGGNEYANEDLGVNGYSIDEDGEFQILVDEYKEEKYFEPEIQKNQGKKKKKKKSKDEKKSIIDEYR